MTCLLTDLDWSPVKGLDEDDKTSYMPEQKSWRGDRLGNIVDAAGKKVFYDDERCIMNKPEISRHWIHDGKVLLDRDNRPVRPWSELNRTVSSAIADWHLEALRRLYRWITVDECDVLMFVLRFITLICIKYHCSDASSEAHARWSTIGTSLS